MQPSKKRAETTGQLIGVRIQPWTAELLDAYRARQKYPPSRPEAIRSLVNGGLALEEATDLLHERRKLGIRPSRYRALIIEPDHLNAATTRILCEAAGIEVVATVRSAEDALAVAERREHNLILSETRVDGADGLGLVNEILVHTPAAVIFITYYLELFLTGDRPEPAFLVAKPVQARPILDLLHRLNDDDNSAQYVAKPHIEEEAKSPARKSAKT